MSATRPRMFALTGTLTAMLATMTGRGNAGVKRNRLQTGVKAEPTRVRLAPSTKKVFEDAAAASGQLSLSLYLELLFRQIEDERGALPVFSPPLDTEVKPTQAA